MSMVRVKWKLEKIVKKAKKKLLSSSCLLSDFFFPEIAIFHQKKSYFKSGRSQSLHLHIGIIMMLSRVQSHSEHKVTCAYVWP